MACLKNLPNEVLHKTVDILVKEGLHGTAVSLASTDKDLESRVLPRIYRSVVENETFFLAHWAAEHGQTSILKRTIEAGADINEPYTTSTSVWKLDDEPEYRRLCTADLDGKELHQAIKQRSNLIANQWTLEEQWYHRTENGYGEISKTQMERLIKYYVAMDGEVNRTGPFDQFAEALETKRMFLDAFAFWATPLHIAIREGNDDIVEALIENEKLDLNASMHGACECRPGWSRLPDNCVFSALHQALCGAKGFYVPQLIRLGTSYLSLTKPMLHASVDTLLVKPVLTTPQPCNLLHEVLSMELPFSWQINANGWSTWCMEQHCRGNPRQWIVNLLLENGYESHLNERDDNNQLAVEIACAVHPDRAIINTLLQRGISQYDSSISVTFTVGGIDDIGSILTWAISRNDLDLAEYLLTHELMQPLFDISAPSVNWGYTALHVLCMYNLWCNGDVSGHLRNQILQKLLTKIEVDTVSGGHTPLTYALEWLVHRPEPDAPPLKLVGILLWHGADVLNGNQETSQTPLEIFLEHIADCKCYPKILHDKTYLCYDQEKEPLLLQAIRQIRLDKHITDRTDAIGEIIQMRLRNPIDLTWVPQALEQLRRIRSARADYQRVDTGSLVSPDDV